MACRKLPITCCELSEFESFLYLCRHARCFTHTEAHGAWGVDFRKLSRVSWSQCLVVNEPGPLWHSSYWFSSFVFMSSSLSFCRRARPSYVSPHGAAALVIPAVSAPALAWGVQATEIICCIFYSVHMLLRQHIGQLLKFTHQIKKSTCIELLAGVILDLAFPSLCLCSSQPGKTTYDLFLHIYD